MRKNSRTVNHMVRELNLLPNGNVQEGEFREGGLWNGTYKDKDGNLISNVIEGNHYY